MSANCLVCLRKSPAGNDYHVACLQSLFGISEVPGIDLELSKLHTVALATVGHASITGVQKKISATLSSDRLTLRVATTDGRFILKPQTDAFQALPENEHLSHCLARAAGIQTATCGIVRLRDGSAAFISRRFDRPASGGKLHQEDFCQLAALPAKEKYEGSAESCVKLMRRYASEPLIEVAKLYRLIVFSWVIGNGDMHLKNFSLLRSADGIYALSPAYDLVNTRLVIPDDDLALPVVGKRSNLDAADWLRFAGYCRIPEKAASRIIGEIADGASEYQSLIKNSLLTDEAKDAYRVLVKRNLRSLA